MLKNNMSLTGGRRYMIKTLDGFFRSECHVLGAA